MSIVINRSLLAIRPSIRNISISTNLPIRTFTINSVKYCKSKDQNADQPTKKTFDEMLEAAKPVDSNASGYRKKYSNPLARTVGIMTDDIKDYFTFGGSSSTQTPVEENVNEADAQKGNIKSKGKTSSSKVGDIFPEHCDVLVIGGGAVGSSVAYHLKERALEGLRVVVVEKDSNYTQASTVLSVGGIRQQFSIAENIQLSQYGMEFLRNIPKNLAIEGQDPPPDINFNPHGYLTLASEGGIQQLKESHYLQTQLGAKNQFLTAKQLKQRFPWLNTEGIEAGVIGLENEGWFDPWSLLIGMKRKAINLGTEYVTGEVTGFELMDLEDSYVEGEASANINQLRSAKVVLPCGEIREITFAMLVVAAGAWSGKIGDMLGIGKGDGIMAQPLPVEPRKRYVYCVHAPEGPGLDCPLVIDPSGTYFRREGLGGLYLTGCSPQHGEGIGYGYKESEEPSVDALDVDYDYFDSHVWPHIANRAPAFNNLKLHSAWAGYYDYNTFDQNGIIGLHPKFSNMLLATGFSGHGIQQAAGVGRAIMELILNGDYATIDLSRLGFDRILFDEHLYEQNIW